MFFRFDSATLSLSSWKSEEDALRGKAPMYRTSSIVKVTGAVAGDAESVSPRGPSKMKFLDAKGQVLVLTVPKDLGAEASREECLWLNSIRHALELSGGWPLPPMWRPPRRLGTTPPSCAS